MGDFIKDLNIIDFLGMLLPGSLYVMAARDMLPVEELMGYFGENPGTAPRITLLIVAGYVIGMIFHEVGDLLEKLLWICPLFDPRTYAAEQTTLVRQVRDQISVSQGDPLEYIRKRDRIFLSAVEGKTDLRKRNLFEGFRTMARNLLLVLLMLLLYPGLSFQERWQSVLYTVACVILFLRYYHYSLLKYKYSYEDHLNEEQVR